MNAPGLDGKPTGREPGFESRSKAHADFIETAKRAGLNPEDPWVGHYVEYEWRHLRHLIINYDLDVRGKDLLEFGCNVGGSAIVLASLGASVTALDVDRELLSVAKANAARYGLASAIELLQIAEGDALPLESASYDFVIANSVLEYVHAGQLRNVIGEFYRVLRPGGALLIAGTASRLTLREGHSRRWLVNYLPRFLDDIADRPLQRGLSPFRLHRILNSEFHLDSGAAWLRVREAIHGNGTPAMRALASFAKVFGISPGWFTPNIEVLARKPV